MSYFTEQTFQFLTQLAENNNQPWFQDHKADYLEKVRDPFLRFIHDVSPQLSEISAYYLGDDRPNGGSLFRIYRDTRFSKDKTPYKTWAGARFKHVEGKRLTAPSFYLHIQPGQVFFGAGLWHPASDTLNRIRQFIDHNPNSWTRIVQSEKFRKQFELTGSSLKRPPRGYDADHPLISDLKRKDFVVVTSLTEKQAISSQFMNTFLECCSGASGFVDYLCAALDLEF